MSPEQIAQMKLDLIAVTSTPWIALDYTEADPPRWFVAPENYHGTICALHPDSGANARLMAAAPEMAAHIISLEYRLKILETPTT